MKESHKALQKYLMCSYQYYIRYTSLIPDTEYDKLAKYLLENYEDWQGHQHAHLISKGDLEAGTLFTLRQGDYPEMVKQGSEIWEGKNSIKMR